MRSGSHLGTCPPCSGRLAVPALWAIERPLKMQRLYSAADNRHLLQRRLRRPEPLVTMKRQPGTAEVASMNLSANMTSGIGQPVRRKEDFRLLTGRGSFADDVHLPDLAHAVIVRSPHAHAHIGSIDKAAALASSGVLAVLAGRDYVADGLAAIPHGAGLMGRPDVAVRVRGFDPITTQDYPMPIDRARFVGEPVALVVAETVDQAKDAAELLEITYEPLPAVVRAADAVKPGAPRLWDDAPDNLCVDIEVGDEAATAAAFQRAAHIVRLATWVQRVTGVPMEPRTTTAEYDAAAGHYTLYAGSGRGVAN